MFVLSKLPAALASLGLCACHALFNSYSALFNAYNALHNTYIHMHTRTRARAHTHTHTNTHTGRRCQRGGGGEKVPGGPFGHDPRRAGLPGSVYYLKKKYFVFQVLSGIFGHDPGALASLGLCIIFFM